MRILKAFALGAAGLAALASIPAAAEDADWYRGGWRSETGAPHVYQFVIRGSAVTGYYCSQCSDGTTLAPLEGTFDETEGLKFAVRYLNPDGSLARVENVTAKLNEGKLVVVAEDGQPFATIKDPRGPAPSVGRINVLPPNAPPVPLLPPRAGPGAGGPPPAAYHPPSPWRKLTAADVVGVWLGFGTGIDKQYFIIRNDGERLFGLACGRCDNPYTHGALENFVIHDDTVEFDIVHQDWGDGPGIPFSRHVTAQIAMNEMHMDARRPDQSGPGIVASLVGPIPLEATAGNVYGE